MNFGAPMLAYPYHRIVRPLKQSPPDAWRYVLDIRYAEDRAQVCQGLCLLQQDLAKLFEFIETADANRRTYSHRTFELLLRASTEFESNCKAILAANKYPGKPEDWTMRDYAKLEPVLRLSEYKLWFKAWYPTHLNFSPVSEWRNGTSPGWYRDYNRVKHNRGQQFAAATFENVVYAVGSVFCIVFAQFGFQALSPFNICEQSGSETFPVGRFTFLPGALFGIQEYQHWPDSDCYSFDWNNLGNTPTPFVAYPFPP